MKKIIIIIGIIILLLAGLGLLLLTQNGGNISIDRITSLFPDTENNPDAGVGGNGSDFGEETELFPDVDIDQEAFPFKQLFSGPVSGFIYTKENMVRFVERETGHIYDYDLATTDLAKASNKTIRGVREVLFYLPIFGTVIFSG